MSENRLSGRILQSAGAASLSAGWRMAVTFLAHMALRRFIPPEQMAVWTWAEPLFVLLSQFRDLGLPAHVVRLRERPWGNYLRVILVWGGALTVLLMALAPLLALGFAGRDELTVPILRVLCLFLFVQGLGILPLTFLDIEHQTVRTIPAELMRNLVFVLLALTLAWRGWGVWSIVLAHVVAATIYTAMLWRACGREIPLRPLAGITAAMVWASLPLMLLSILELGVLHLEPLILGLRLPAAAVGTAGLAVMAVFLVSRQIADATGRVLYPAMARLRDRVGDGFRLYRTATLFLSTVVASGAFFFFWNAELVALILGGEKWVGAADYLRFAAFVPFLRPLTMFGRELLLVHHRDRLLIGYTLVNLTAIGGLGLWWTSTSWGALGMAAASYFPVGTLLLAWGLHQLDRAQFSSLLLELLQVYGLTALCFLPIWWLPPSQWLVAGVSGGAGLVASALCFWRFRDHYRWFLRH